MSAVRVEAVHRNQLHAISKTSVPRIQLVAGIGVEGDCHAGATVQHRSRVARDASQPNLRQIHLIHAELYDDLVDRGFGLTPGSMGENVTTRGLDLLSLPTDTCLRLGSHAVVRLSGLRNPCAQLDGLRPGLMQAVLRRSPQGQLIRLAGVMAVVEQGGEVTPGDPIILERPGDPLRPLRPV